MNYEKLARQRVAENSDLLQHEEAIFYDWSNWDEHMDWVATASIQEIVSWAVNIEGFSQANAALLLGRKGGSAKSERKAKSSAANGRLGGRPARG